MKKVKIAYIGGGSKMWARVFMNDLALNEDISGEIALYDIDIEAAKRNQSIGRRINELETVKSKFEYVVYECLEECLVGATFVVISILPGTFTEMASDVHAPEKYGIYQSVGDTAGPGGVLRAMRTVPLYEGFAMAIKKCCPEAWVINFTNPMSICVKALYDVFPQIKAFGCCHEVFHAQDFLCLCLDKVMGIKATRKDIYTDASGINHFTWITEAFYQNINLLDLVKPFADKYFDLGYYEGGKRFQFRTDTFAYGNKVKMDLYRKYGVLAAAGDRHLVEFFDRAWYLKNPSTVKYWRYGLTTVKFREEQQIKLIAESQELADGVKPVVLTKSAEEAVDLLRALLGLDKIVSNVNMPNYGQMPGVALGSIVETNCVFAHNMVKPVQAKPLPVAVLNLVNRATLNVDTCYEGIKNRDFQTIFNAFANQPLCAGIQRDKLRSLFIEMVNNTRNYLADYYNLEKVEDIF